MTAEALNFSEKIVTPKNNKSGFFEYKPCCGKPGSSLTNWVPVDFLASKIADILRLSDDEMKKKHRD